MAIIRKVMRLEIGKEQCGFVADSGTRIAIIVIRILNDKVIETERSVYLFFKLHESFFDRVKHGKIMELLQRLDTDGKRHSVD